jgi:hypothetical protein
VLASGEGDSDSFVRDVDGDALDRGWLPSAVRIIVGHRHVTWEISLMTFQADELFHAASYRRVSQGLEQPEQPRSIEIRF